MFKVLLIDVNYFYVPVENIGLDSLSSYLRAKNIDVTLLSMDANQDIEKLKAMIPMGYNLYGFSLFHTTATLVFELSRYIKNTNSNAKICVGGYLATDAYDLVLNECLEIDFVVLGFGEHPLYEAVRSIINGEPLSQLESIATRNDIVKKLPNTKEIPKGCWPSRDLLVESIKRGCYTARISTSRGCCGNCTFCSANQFSKAANTKRWTGRDISDVYNEVLNIYNEFGIRSFTFNDGSFEDPGQLGKQRILDFCNAVVSHDTEPFSFWCFIRADSFCENDLSLIQLMRKSGFTQVYIGIEAASPEDLKLYGKNATPLDNERSIQLFKKCDIDVQTGFMIINPFSTKQTIYENFKFLEKHQISSFDNYTRQTWVLYGTKLYFKCKEKGLLSEKYSYRNPTAYDFIDPYVSSVSQFFNETVYHSTLNAEFTNFFDIHTMIHSLKALFPGYTTHYEEELKKIEDKLFEVLVDYFRLLYELYDLPKARASFDEFEKKMLGIYQEAKLLRLKVSRNRYFRDYLQGKTMKNKIAITDKKVSL